MGSYQINIFVARSNPLLMRTLQISDNATFRELTELTAISFGLEHNFSRCYLNEQDCPLDEKLSTLLTEEAEGVLSLAAENTPTLVLHFTVEKKLPKDCDVPSVIDHTGFNLPQTLFDYAFINFLQRELSQNKSVLFQGISYSATTLLFSESKTENAIRKRFAPETATKEINLGLTLPLMTILSALRIVDLKQLYSNLKVYCTIYDSYSLKKVDLIQLLHGTILARGIEKLFYRLPLTEYLRFRAYAQAESQAELTNALAELPSFASVGLVTKTDTGVYFAREVLEYYDTWFHTDKETKYLEEQVLKQAMLICCQLYGVFSFEMFTSVVDKLKVQPISSSRIKDYFDDADSIQTLTGAVYTPDALDDTIKYDRSWIKYRTAVKLWNYSYHSKNSWYIPDEAQIRLLLEQEFLISVEQMLPLYNVALEYSRYSSTEAVARDFCRNLIHMLQLGNSREKTIEFATSNLRYLYERTEREKLEAFFVSWIDANQVTIPRASLGGYSVQNCPAWLRTAIAEKTSKLEAERKQRALEKRLAKQKGY